VDGRLGHRVGASPLTLITEAVFARCLSAQKDERVAASGVLKRPRGPLPGGQKRRSSTTWRWPLYASKIISYAQGFALLARDGPGVGLDDQQRGPVALMWRGGCIIRSVFLGKIKEAFDRKPAAHQPAGRSLLCRRGRGAPQPGWRRTVGHGGCLRYPAAGDRRGPGVLRRLPQRPAAGQPAPGRSATTSAPTPTNASIGRAASSSTPTGPAGGAPRPRPPTTCERRAQHGPQPGSGEPRLTKSAAGVLIGGHP